MDNSYYFFGAQCIESDVSFVVSIPDMRIRFAREEGPKWQIVIIAGYDNGDTFNIVDHRIINNVEPETVSAALALMVEGGEELEKETQAVFYKILEPFFDANGINSAEFRIIP